jgi:hypothetical protein
MTITKPAKTHTFVPTTVAKASEVNTNFDNVFGVYDTTGYLFDGWFALAGASLEYNAAESLKTTTDVDLTSDIQVGDKITFEQSSTEKFAIVTAINYNSTVANRTYIQVMGDTVANSAITAGTVGFSRAVRPSKFPIVDFGGARNQGLINGKIVPSVASNNLTVAIQTLAGTTPSATNPVGIWIGDTLRWITGALSISANAGTNWFNSGSAELATKEIDYFAYIGYNATDGITLGFARIPYARLYSDFNTTTTNERYARISTITNAAAGDNYINIGRFAATLSASPSHNWSVPTFDNANLIQEPVYETRWLDWTPQYPTYIAMTVSEIVDSRNRAKYRVENDMVWMEHSKVLTYGGTGNIGHNITLPFTSGTSANQGGRFSFTVGTIINVGGRATGGDTGPTNEVFISKYDVSNFTLGNYWCQWSGFFNLR